MKNKNNKRTAGFRDNRPKPKFSKSVSENRNTKPLNTKISPDPETNSREQSISFGIQPILETLRANPRRIEKILIAEGAREGRISDILNLARINHIRTQKVSRESLSKYARDNANHQGVIAFTASSDYVDADELLTEITAKENCLVLILDGVEDPRNLGAILRAAECAGVDGVFIPEHRAVGLTETVVKTSAGATEYIKVAKVKNINRLIEELKSHNIWVVGTSADTKTIYSDWDWKQSSALVLGSEGRGLHRLVAENCDVLVKIPMRGKIESLNVSVACGVILFEALRQRI